MKKLLLSLFAISGIFLLTGCSLTGTTNKTTVDNNSELNNQISLLQQQMSGLNAEIQELKEQNDELITENETIKTSLSDQNSGENILVSQNKELKKNIEELQKNVEKYKNNTKKYKQLYVDEKNKKNINIEEKTQNIIDSNILTFINTNGGYSFKYPDDWKAVVNHYNINDSLFGPNATSQSAIGGVTVEKYNGTLDEYIHWLENNVAATYISLENLTINGINAIRREYVGTPTGGFSVFIKKDNYIYTIFMEDSTSNNIKIFNDLVNSFKIIK